MARARSWAGLLVNLAIMIADGHRRPGWAVDAAENSAPTELVQHPPGLLNR